MNKKDFKTCMQQGRGGCVLALKSEKNIEKYKDIVLWGCLHNLGYDTQCEGTRAEYVYHLTTFFCDEAYFVAPIIKAFTSLANEKDDLFQHFSTLLSLFAKSGNEDALLALQQKYDALFSVLLNKRSFEAYDFERDDFERICVSLLHQCKENINLKVIGDLGRLFRENPHYDCDYFDWFCFCLKKRLGKDGLQAFLNDHSQKSENVKCFYESYLQLKKANSNRHPTTKLAKAPSVEEIKNEIASTGRIAPISRVRFSRHADEDMRKELTKEIVAEADLDKKAELLSLFYKNNFPSSHEIIIEYVESAHERLRDTALIALTNCESEIVRNYALSLLQSETHKTLALKMLLQNYKPDDKELLLRAFYALEVEYEGECDWHGIGYKILDIYANGKELPKEFLLYIYNTTLCSCCRFTAVRELDKRQWLTPDIIEECKHDSNKNITEYINRTYPEE